MHRSSRELWQTVGMCVALLPVSAHADPIAIVSGLAVVDVGAIGTGSISLAAPSFALSGSLGQGSFAPAACGFGPHPTACRPGTSLSLHGFWSGLDVGFDAAFKGEPFTGGSASDGPGLANFSAEFFGTALLPPWTGSGSQTSARFQFEGVLSHTSGSGDEFRSFRQPFTGAGTATLFLTPFTEADPLWQVQRVVYDFDTAAPIPEPGTLLLLGAGLAVVGGRRYSAKRKRTRRHSCR